MPTTRSTIELEALRAEAERRVRAGESRADVARALDVAATTLSQWALRGRWRRKDIEAEQGGEMQARADAAIAKLRGEEEVSKAEARRAREAAAQAVAAAVAARAAAEAEARAARDALRQAQGEAEAARAEAARVVEMMRGAASAGEDAGGPFRHPASPDATSPSFAGGGQAPVAEVNPVELAQASMAKAQELMGRGRMEEAERAARVAGRVLDAMEQIEQRQARVQEQAAKQAEAERAAAAEAEMIANWTPYDPERDPKWRERTMMRSKLDELIERMEREVKAEAESGGRALLAP